MPINLSALYIFGERVHVCTHVYTCVSLLYLPGISGHSFCLVVSLLHARQSQTHQLCGLEKLLDITGLLVQLQYFLWGKSDILGTFMDDFCLYLSLAY